MDTPRTFSAAEVSELIELLRSCGDIPVSELAGMEKLSQLLFQFENMADADIANEVKRHFKHV